MEEIYVDDYNKPVDPTPSTNQTGPRSSERRLHGALLLCLGLLSVVLLVGLISLGVTYWDLAAEHSTVKANLTERLQASNDKLSSVSEERDLLNANLTSVSKELDRLQSLSKQRCSCPEGWKMFHCACFFLSGESGNWDKGRDDCIDRGADLVVIDSAEEQTFVSNFTKNRTMAWIGMTDRVKEGAWTWINRTPVTLQYWKTSQPDNGGGHHTRGHEDCAHIIIGGSHLNWNDLSCKTSLRWICEKVV